MTAVLILRGVSYNVPAGQTLLEAIQAVGLHPEQYLAVRNGALIGLDTILNPADQVRLVPVISGGMARY